MELLFYLYISVWVVYNIAIYAKFGLLDSVSASHYELKKTNKNLGWIFTIFSWAYAFPAMMLTTTGLMFFAGGFICFVGVAANYKDNPMDQKFHGVFAKLAVLLSQLSIIFDYHYYYLSLCSISLLIIFYLLRNKVFSYVYWMEQLAWLSIGITLYLKLKSYG